MPETGPTPPPIIDFLAAVRDRHAAAEGGGWYLAPEPHAEPGTVRTTISGYQRMIGVFDFRGAPATADANRTFVLHAHGDIGYLLAELDRYADRADMAARIRELELALGGAAALLRSAAMRVSAGQTPDYDQMRGGADELQQIANARPATPTSPSEEPTR